MSHSTQMAKSAKERESAFVRATKVQAVPAVGEALCKAPGKPQSSRQTSPWAQGLLLHVVRGVRVGGEVGERQSK